MYTDTTNQARTEHLSSSSSPIYSKAYDLDTAIINAQNKLLSLQDESG